MNQIELSNTTKALMDNAVSSKGNGLAKPDSGAAFSSVMDKAGQASGSSSGYGSSFNNRLFVNDISTVLKQSSSKADVAGAKDTSSKNQKEMQKDVKQAKCVQENGVEASVENVYTSELTYKLKEALGLSDEEIEEVLANMGICAGQLFEPQVLQQFVLESFGAEEMSEALLNEELSDALMAASSILEEVVSSLQNEIVELPELPQESEPFENMLSKQSDVEVEIHKDAKAENEGGFAKRDKDQHGNGQVENANFVDYFANKVNVNAVDTGEMTVPEFKQIVTDLVDKIRMHINPANTSVELMLNPEHLGKVQVVVAHKEGMLTAHLKVENHIAKEALESSLQQLKQSFEDQGLKVDKVEVAIGNYSSEYAEQEGNQNEQAYEGFKKKLRIEEYLEDAYADSEEEAKEMVSSLTGTVEYTA